MSKTKIARKTLKEFISLGRNSCERCGRTETAMLTLDHIVPISILLGSGISLEEAYEEKYLTILCRICNQQKAARLDFNDIRTKIILTEILNRVWPV